MDRVAHTDIRDELRLGLDAAEAGLGPVRTAEIRILLDAAEYGVAALYAKAVRQVGAGQRPGRAASPPERCPFTLDELLSENVDIAALVARLRAAP